LPPVSSDASLHNWDNIKTLVPDPVDVEGSHGDLDDPCGSRHVNNGENTQPAPLETPDDYDILSSGFEDLWMKEMIHLINLRTSVDFIHVL
jgi:hypothetical protein